MANGKDTGRILGAQRADPTGQPFRKPADPFYNPPDDPKRDGSGSLGKPKAPVVYPGNKAKDMNAGADGSKFKPQKKFGNRGEEVSNKEFYPTPPKSGPKKSTWPD
jgi:hypothetical protein